MVSIALCAVPALCFVGCGASTMPYSAGATTECLDSNVSAATIDYLGTDRLSRRASGGSYRVEIGGNSAVLAFWGSPRAATEAVSRYGRIAAAAGVPSTSLLTRKRNVSIEWQDTPGRSDADAITHCLRTS